LRFKDRLAGYLSLLMDDVPSDIRNVLRAHTNYLKEPVLRQLARSIMLIYNCGE